MENVQCPKCKLWGAPIRKGHHACRDCEIAEEQQDYLLMEDLGTGLFGKIDEFLAELVLGPDDVAVPGDTSVAALRKTMEKHFTKATVDRMRGLRWKP